MESSRFSLDSTTTFAASPTSPSTTHAFPKLHGEGLGLLKNWEKTPPSPGTVIRSWRDDTTNPEEQKPARRPRALVVTIYLLAFFTIFISICAVWGFVALSKSDTTAQCVSQAAVEKDNVLHLASDINGFVPEFPLHRQTFHPDEANITSFFPLGNGFVTIPPAINPNHHHLPPPMRYNNQQVYSVAVFHQLHCLQMIMTGYNSLADGGGKSDGHTDHKHIHHCFSYLRQSLMCCGDTALEGQNPETDGSKVETSGMGVVHQCKDYRGIVEWVEGRRVSDEKGV
ncbi:hypothetical protein QBC40DRAFT_320463 [Triangularia verruculosa]|uniref:Tat pathway signal sequence n=1 Tax=Triangularia verruculosa TaxID=2587418 RepID=A0AAN7B243_9PEZI|nr:hypothetical protein QBC40DRAFT_320463 [Triangularia verruculosa]